MSDLDRIREKQSDTAEVVQGDVPDPRENDEPRTTAEDPTEALRAFTLASTEVALDTNPAGDDDYAFVDFGLLVTRHAATDRALMVTLDDGRQYRVTVNVERVTSGADLLGLTPPK